MCFWHLNCLAHGFLRLHCEVCAGGSAARWGYCLNRPGEACDGADADAALGFGIRGEDCCAVGAGWTNHFVGASPERPAPCGPEGRREYHSATLECSVSTLSDRCQSSL